MDKILAAKVAAAHPDPIGAGVTPLEIMVEMMRDHEQEPGIRLAAAKGAAEYVHRKMPTAVELTGNVTYTPAPVNKLALPPHLAEKMK